MEQILEDQKRLTKVLEWLYTHDGTCPTKEKWKEELVKQLYFLANITND